MQATNNGKETEPDFRAYSYSSLPVPPKQVNPLKWGVRTKAGFPGTRVWSVINCLNRVGKAINLCVVLTKRVV